MLERIERVERVKRIDNDVGKSFARRQGYDDSGKNGKDFAQVLRDTLRGGGAMSEREVPAAYALEISAAPKVTQSLFYENFGSINGIATRFIGR